MQKRNEINALIEAGITKDKVQQQLTSFFGYMCSRSYINVSSVTIMTGINLNWHIIKSFVMLNFGYKLMR